MTTTPKQFEKTVEVLSTTEVSLNDIGNLLVTAFEGGSTWISQLNVESLPDGFDTLEELKEAVKGTELEQWIPYRFYLVPLAGGTISFTDAENGPDSDRFYLNLETIKEGLRIWANSKDYANHWSDFVSENWDAITADIFIQFCVFGEVIYG